METKARRAHRLKWKSKPCPVCPIGGFNPAACFDIWLATFHIREMLYDTPFPTELQNELAPAQTERNKEIRARYEAGESGASFAQAFGISKQRVNQIIRGRRS